MDLGSLPADSYDHNTLEQCQHYQSSENQPAVKTAELLGNEIVQLAACINAAQYQFLVLLEQFDIQQGWSCGETRSCAHWLNWRCGISMGTAREKVRVAHALPELPQISEAFKNGKISFSKVRAMTRIATPENEGLLMNIARWGSASQLEKLIQAYRHCDSVEKLAAERKQANEQHYNRKLDYHWQADGCLVLSAVLSPEIGAKLLIALNSAYETLQDDESGDVAASVTDKNVPEYRATQFRATENHPPESLSIDHNNTSESVEKHKARRADALNLLADSWLSHPVMESKQADRYQVVVTVDANTLAHKLAHNPNEKSPSVCAIGNDCGNDYALENRNVSADTARRLSCDCSLVGVLVNGEQPLTVGRKSRKIPAHIHRALKIRDKGCRFPGCAASRFTEAHHIQHWSNGGETSLDNLITLCSHHHHLLHEGGYQVTHVPTASCREEFIFHDANGNAIPNEPPVPDIIDDLFEQSRSANIPVTHDTLWHWSGDTLDYNGVLDALFQKRILYL